MPIGLAGGTRHYEIGKALSAQGFAVEVITSDFHISEHRHLLLRWPRLWKSESFGSLRWRWLWASGYKRNNWRRHLNLLTFAGSLFTFGVFRRTPAVIIGSTPHLIAAFAAFLLARLKRCHFYLEVRDLWPQVLIDMGGKSPRSPVVRILGWMEGVLYRNSHRVLVLAPGAVDYVRERGASADKILWVPNGVSLVDLESLPDLDQARMEFKVDHDRFVLLYTGAHGTANSLATLVQAAAILDSQAPGQFRIILVGDGMEKDCLINQSRDIECLRFVDPVPKSDLPRLLQAADALVLTLLDVPVFRYGVSPRKLYDYYSAAKPVVVNIGGAVSEEVETQRCGVTASPENPEALAAAILKLSRMPAEERVEMGLRSRRLAESTYNMEVIAERIGTQLREDLQPLS
jgi:glycosyltransferase involved in cell wall biosynthesis